MINLKQWHGQLATRDSGLKGLRRHSHRLVWHHTIGARYIGWKVGQEIARR
jgi:hypothetical protein